MSRASLCIGAANQNLTTLPSHDPPNRPCPPRTPNTQQAFVGAAKEMKDGKVVSPSWISGNLLRCMVLNIAGIVLTTLALESAMGAWGRQECIAIDQTYVLQQDRSPALGP